MCRIILYEIRLQGRANVKEQIDYVDPSELLAGEDLGNGWVVTEKVARDPNLSGGHFSVGYTTLNSETGEVAFLKALNFRPAVGAEDRLRVLQSLSVRSSTSATFC